MPSTDQATTAEAQLGLRRAQANTTRLGALLVISSTLILSQLIPALTGTTPPFRIQWWMLAAGFALAEFAVFHIEINREAHTFSLSEIPTVIALLFASPAAFVVGRLVGEALTLVLRDRQPVAKLVFNLSMFLGECTIALAVFHLLGGSGDITSAATWLAATVAVMAADTLSVLCVLLAIHWHGARPEPRTLFGVATLTAVVNTSIAVAASLLLVVNRLSAVLLFVLITVVYVTYRSYSHLIQRHSDLEMLYDFTTVVSRTVHAEEVVDELLNQAQKLLRAGYAEIVVEHENGEVQRMHRGELTSGDVPAGDALRERVIADRRTIVVSRTTKDAVLRRYADEQHYKDVIVAPLTGDSRIIGTILVANRLGEVSSFDDEDGRLFETFVNHASVALENGRLVDRLSAEVSEREHQATHDALTGLPNRLLFFRRVRERLDAADLSDNTPFAVMLMDLDRFKDVNDTLGHHAGDLVLQEVAHRLTSAVAPDVTIARLGGDEFAVVMPHCSTADEARAAACRLLDYLAQPCYVEGMTVDVGASVGVSLFPRHGADVAGLLRRADVAMYLAKTSSDHVALYDFGGDEHSPRRLELTSALRKAVEGDELEVHYQPKVRIEDGSVTGVEALVRWTHPTLGSVRPDEFIPVAEQTGIVVPLTSFVLRRALRDVAAWRQKGFDLSIAVNISVRSLADSAIVDVVADLLLHAGVPADRLTLEVTETGVMTDPKRAIEALEALAALGVRTSVDDFGTGYSSLSYLQRLPVSEVKIDRSFVMTMTADPNSAAIVRSVIDLGRNLGLDVVAEGVEDDLALQRLRKLGCHYAQGFLFSRPIAADALEEWLVARLALAAVHA